MTKEVEEKAPKSTQTWKCPKCSNKLTTFVKLSQAPTCNNPKSHITAPVLMVLAK